MKPIQVMIIDDSALMRQMLTQMLSGEPGINVIATAQDPADIETKLKKFKPDVVTLDITMPSIDGVDYLERLLALHTPPVIVISDLTPETTDITLRALEIGAFDYLERPQDISDTAQLVEVGQRLRAVVRAAANARAIHHHGDTRPERSLHYKAKRVGLPIIAMGASTGGVEALRFILARMPSIAPPIVIAQHMPAGYTAAFAARLNKLAQVTVVEAVQGARLQNGYAIIAPGGKHLTIKRIGDEFICQLDDEERIGGHRPSIDKLFASVADAVGADAIGLLLTGMGRDGAAGLLAMRGRGAHTIVQDEASSLVYGMPKAALTLNAASIQMPLEDMPRHLLDTSRDMNLKPDVA